MTLRTALARLLTQMEADGKSPLTIQVYRGELERFAKHAGSTKRVHEFRPDMIARYFTDDAARLQPDGTPRSARTINRTKAALRLLFRYLHDTGAISRDPTRVLKNARTDRKEPAVMTREEAARFVAGLKARAVDALGHRDQVLFMLLLRSGMRLGAAIALELPRLWRDLATNYFNARFRHLCEPREVLPSRSLLYLGISVLPCA